MKIITLFFGITTDLVGATQLEIKVDENTSVQHFKSLIKEKYPTLENINSYAIAVNESYATEALILKEGDTVAIIPPVSGG
ncbi:molybdopterin converting factor subunit 1 [Polaribacter aquimarinus]|uniref:Molybdopterin synthase sulfur carrier subunit n=1 Tax=Polaribacter aquimarinus TaxID=2100726 RepID=A0A2U2JBQ2_9FLAO|nr:molybdopterin converting factor subunit 1 [Polaribacter aquimarinus]PWG05752.1 molybdopterin converting factor subunit 1 [Polaribacter aquimarinus]